ncbi:MAG: FAD binding domain-containing protein [Lachnospiraceae bacterium]|nr:FAD binding domain-containing protein [Lachnospiraceae bacterium]
MITIRRYKKAESIEEAWQLNQQKSSRIIGGMLWLKMGKGTVQTAIDLSGLSLDGIEETEEEFRVGCMATLRQLELHEGLGTYTGGAMKEALRHIVGVQFRNLATVGGSIFGRFGFSDVLTMFLAMDSYVELYKAGVVSMREFAGGGYDRDVLVRILVRKQPASFHYSSVRNSQTDFPALTCAAARFEGPAGADYRFAIGARPGRAVVIEDSGRILSGGDIREQARAFGEYAAAHVPTGSNMRGSAQYRTHLVKVLTERAILQMGGEAGC